MIIWIVSEHEHYQTGDVRYVCDSREKALRYIFENYLKGISKKDIEHHKGQYSESWTISTVTYQIEKWEVE